MNSIVTEMKTYNIMAGGDGNTPVTTVNTSIRAGQYATLSVSITNAGAVKEHAEEVTAEVMEAVGQFLADAHDREIPVAKE